jgi:hypothetical protein
MDTRQDPKLPKQKEPILFWFARVQLYYYKNNEKTHRILAIQFFKKIHSFLHSLVCSVHSVLRRECMMG